MFAPLRLGDIFTPEYIAQYWTFSNIGTPEALFQTIINILLFLIALVAIIALIYGGYQYITSFGNPEQAVKAKNTLFGAALGIIIAFAAYAVVNFIIIRLVGG